MSFGPSYLLRDDASCLERVAFRQQRYLERMQEVGELVDVTCHVSDWFVFVPLVETAEQRKNMILVIFCWFDVLRNGTTVSWGSSRTVF